MAAQIVYENPTLKDYFYLGTSHPGDIDLSTYTIPTIKIYAEKDGHASLREVIENKSKLPPNFNICLLMLVIISNSYLLDVS